MEIHLLSEETINRIAAGEVVERPVNVVKELVENAIDAGATAITCEIREGGKKMIRITDNGCGIEKSEIGKAFARHATSKIRDDSDLTKLMPGSGPLTSRSAAFPRTIRYSWTWRRSALLTAPAWSYATSFTMCLSARGS